MIPLLHAQLILKNEFVEEMATIFCNHTWIFGVNHTDLPFYTSDHPIVKHGHKEDDFLSYNGFASEGIEIAFPINSKLILLMYDRKMFPEMSLYENRFLQITDVDNIVYYNSLQVYQSYRQIFCDKNDFSLAYRMCEKNPDICNEHRERFSID